MMRRGLPIRRPSGMGCYFVLFQLVAQSVVVVLIVVGTRGTGNSGKDHSSSISKFHLSSLKSTPDKFSSSAAIDSVTTVRKQLQFTQNDRSWLSVVYHEEVSPQLKPAQEVFNQSVTLQQFCQEAARNDGKEKTAAGTRYAVFRNAMLVQRQLLLPSTIDCNQIPRNLTLMTPFHLGQNTTPTLEIRVVPNTDSFLDFESGYSCHERVYEPSVLFSLINWPQHGHAMFNGISLLWEAFQHPETGPLSLTGKNVRLYAYGDALNSDLRQEWQQYAPFLHMEHLESMMTLFSHQPVRSLASLLMQSERHPVCFTYLLAGLAGTLDHYNYNVPLKLWRDFANSVRAHFAVPITPRVVSPKAKPLERVIPMNLQGDWKWEDILPLGDIMPIDWTHETMVNRPRLVILNRKENRFLLNAEDLLEIARSSRAFKSANIVYLEDLQWEDQIRLMGETDMLFGIDGTGLMNGIFMPEGGVVVHARPYGCAEFLPMKGTNFDRMFSANPGRVIRYESNDRSTTVLPTNIPEREELAFNHNSTIAYRFPFILRQDTRIDPKAFRCILASGAKLLHGIPVNWTEHNLCTQSVFL